MHEKIIITSFLYTICLLSISTVSVDDVYTNTTNNTIANVFENQTSIDDTIYLDERTCSHSHLNGAEGILISKNLTIIGKGADNTINRCRKN